jgi:hypothetical protein
MQPLRLYELLNVEMARKLEQRNVMMAIQQMVMDASQTALLLKLGGYDQEVALQLQIPALNVQPDSIKTMLRILQHESQSEEMAWRQVPRNVMTAIQQMEMDVNLTVRVSNQIGYAKEGAPLLKMFVKNAKLAINQTAIPTLRIESTFVEMEEESALRYEMMETLGMEMDAAQIVFL